MASRDTARGRITVGLIVAAILVVTFAALVVAKIGRRVWEEQTIVRADFRTVNGLRVGSAVQLAGVSVGRVDRVDFVQVTYECDSLTEDIGRFGSGRTDNCDSTTFCGPVGLCADLEPMRAEGMYTHCIESGDCREDEVCITSEFRNRSRRVVWAGPEGVCVQYQTEHTRVRVEMSVPQPLSVLVRHDSRAVVASNSVLGDQVVALTPGFGDPLPESHLVQARTSLYEDIELIRERLERVTENVQIAMDAVTDVVAELNDPRMIAAIRGTLEHLDVITGQIVRGDGLVGGLVSEPDFKRDFALTLHGIQQTVAGISGIVSRSNSILSKFDDNLGPLLTEVQDTNAAIKRLIVALEDPENQSLLAVAMDERSAQLGDDLSVILAQSEELTGMLSTITGRIDRGEGTVGKLVDDPKLADDLTRALDRLESHRRVAALLRFILQVTDTVDVRGMRDPAGPG